MKYVSIDIETTGVDREKCKILSIGAVIEDTEKDIPTKDLPRFHAAIIGREGFYGEPFALNMNRNLIQTIVQYQTAKDQNERNDLENLTEMQFLKEEEVAIEFYYWLYANKAFEYDFFKIVKTIAMHPKYGTVPAITSNPTKAYLNVAGKNFATFDKVFLENLPRWKQLIECRNRIIDPAILFVDWERDTSLPNLTACKERAGIKGEVTHNALEDALDVVAILRKIYFKTKTKSNG